jgi:hypothetical protein
MTKYNYFVKFLKKFYSLINSLLKKYLNKLNTNNLLNIAGSNKVIWIFVVFFILFLSYLSIPHTYNKIEIQKELQNQLSDKFNLNFVFDKKFNYRFFPSPHFIAENLYILDEKVNISDIKKIQIFVSLDNLFSLKKINVKKVNIENANFNLDKKNIHFFLKLLDNNFLESKLNIKNSNVFFKNMNQEALFINKIINMNYYYDSKDLKNIVISDNEIFNIPYSFMLYKDKIEKKIFSKINLKFLNFQIENEFDYRNDQKKGNLNFIYNKNKSEASYEFSKDHINFNLIDSLISSKFTYQGKINFKPFYSIIKGNVDKMNVSHLFFSDSIYSQLFKTEILNNKNLNIDLNINSKKTFEFQNIIDLILNLKIQEGLIDVNNTTFSWNDYVDFEVLDSLLYVNKNQLILDGKIVLIINNNNEIYKFLQISKNLRPELKKIELNFFYNFDEQIVHFNTVKINDQINVNASKVLDKVILKKNRLQNKILLKNKIKEAIAAYVG